MHGVNIDADNAIIIVNYSYLDKAFLNLIQELGDLFYTGSVVSRPLVVDSCLDI